MSQLSKKDLLLKARSQGIFLPEDTTKEEILEHLRKQDESKIGDINPARSPIPRSRSLSPRSGDIDLIGPMRAIGTGKYYETLKMLPLTTEYKTLKKVQKNVAEGEYVNKKAIFQGEESEEEEKSKEKEEIKSILKSPKKKSPRKAVKIKEPSSVKEVVEAMDPFDFVKHKEDFNLFKNFSGLERYLRTAIWLENKDQIMKKDGQKGVDKLMAEYKASKIKKNFLESATNSFSYEDIMRKWYQHFAPEKLKYNFIPNLLIKNKGCEDVLFNQLYKSYVDKKWDGSTKLWFADCKQAEEEKPTPVKEKVKEKSPVKEKVKEKSPLKLKPSLKPALKLKPSPRKAQEQAEQPQEKAKPSLKPILPMKKSPRSGEAQVGTVKPVLKVKPSPRGGQVTTKATVPLKKAIPAKAKSPLKIPVKTKSPVKEPSPEPVKPKKVPKKKEKTPEPEESESESESESEESKSESEEEYESESETEKRKKSKKPETTGKSSVFHPVKAVMEEEIREQVRYPGQTIKDVKTFVTKENISQVKLPTFSTKVVPQAKTKKSKAKAPAQLIKAFNPEQKVAENVLKIDKSKLVEGSAKGGKAATLEELKDIARSLNIKTSLKKNLLLESIKKKLKEMGEL